MTDLHTIEDLYSSYQAAKAALTEVEAESKRLEGAIESLERLELHRDHPMAADGDYIKAADGRFVFVSGRRFFMSSVTDIPITDSEWLKLSNSTRRIKEAAATFLGLREKLQNMDADAGSCAKKADAALEAFNAALIDLPKDESYILPSGKLMLSIYDTLNLSWLVKPII